MSALDYPAFDADNHYYEALDSFTRHLDPKLGPRTVQWARSTGGSTTWSAARVSHAVTNPTFDPIAMPGALHDYFRGNLRASADSSTAARSRADSRRTTATPTRA